MDLAKETNIFLVNFLTRFKPYDLSKEDINVLAKDKAIFIVNKLIRKKFRRRKLADKTKHTIKEKVNISIKDNRPLHFVIPFGGYKHFWNPSHPEPDWAELFNFRYLTEYLSPIIACYKPGAIIEYVSEDVILNRMNNYPIQAMDTYSEIFKHLIEWYNTKVPDNLRFKFSRVKERCNYKKLIEEVEKLLPQRKVEFEKLPPDKKELELHRSRRSVMWKGHADLTKLTDEEKNQRIIESRLVELAYYEIEAKPEYLGSYFGEDNHICICFSWGISHDNDPFEDLTLGSTYGSIVDHWIGRGILYMKDNRFIPDIVSKIQYESLSSKQIINTPNFLPYKNFQQIEVSF